MSDGGPGSPPDFEVTFTLVGGQRIETVLDAELLKTMVQTVAVPPRSGESREDLVSMIVSKMASGFENDAPWLATDKRGVTWMFQRTALVSIEMRDARPEAPRRPPGFVPPSG